MLRAIDCQGNKLVPTKQVVAHMGPIKVDHWAHFHTRDCDPWSNGETDWHLAWKDVADSKGCITEFVIENYGERHRADIVHPKGTFIELQASPLSSVDIRSRELFYGDDMLWIYLNQWEHNLVEGPYGPDLLWWKYPRRLMLEHNRPVYWHVGMPDDGPARLQRVKLEERKGRVYVRRWSKTIELAA